MKKFLGKKPFKVVQNEEGVSQEILNNIVSVNNYLLERPQRGTPAETVPWLFIRSVSNLGVRFPIVFTTKDEPYLAINCSLQMDLFDTKSKQFRSGVYRPNNVFFIRGLVSRPNFVHLMKHFRRLLSSEYGGNVDTSLPGSLGNRYVVCLSNAGINFLHTLLHIAITGGGEVIDYSWIAPLQELIEEKEEAQLKRKKSSPRGVFTGDTDEDLIINHVTPPGFSPGFSTPRATKNKSLADAKATLEKLEKIKKAANKVAQPYNPYI